MDKVWVKKKDPTRACYDLEHGFGVYGDHEQEVPNTSFIQSKIKSGELILVQKDQKKGHQQTTAVPTEKLTVDQFKDLKADEQKALLKTLSIDPGSNEEERVAQYTEWLTQQEQGAGQ